MLQNMYYVQNIKSLETGKYRINQEGHEREFLIYDD